MGEAKRRRKAGYRIAEEAAKAIREAQKGLTREDLISAAMAGFADDPTATGATIVFNDSTARYKGETMYIPRPSKARR